MLFSPGILSWLIVIKTQLLPVITNINIINQLDKVGKVFHFMSIPAITHFINGFGFRPVIEYDPVCRHGHTCTVSTMMAMYKDRAFPVFYDFQG